MVQFCVSRLSWLEIASEAIACSRSPPAASSAKRYPAAAAPGLVLADAFDCGALGRAAAGRAVEADVEAAVLAEHDRRGPAQDHAAVGGGEQAVDPGFAVAAQVLVLVVGGRRRLGGPGRHGLGEMSHKPV